MPVKPDDITWFIDTIQNVPIGYDDELKTRFGKLGKAIMKELAGLLGCDTAESRTIEFNEGGIAVSGEIGLYTDDRYVQFSQSHPDFGILYRKGKVVEKYGKRVRDGNDGPNRWLPWAALRDLPKAAAAIARAREESRPGPVPSGYYKCDVDGDVFVKS